MPPASNPGGSDPLTSSSVTPFQVIQLNFLLGFFQLFLYFTQTLLDLLILALEEKFEVSDPPTTGGHLTEAPPAPDWPFPAQPSPWHLHSQGPPTLSTFLSRGTCKTKP